MMEHLKVGVAVSEESVHVVVLSFEWVGGLHEDQLDPQEGGLVISVSFAYWALAGWSPAWWSGDQVMVRVGSMRRGPRASSVSLPEVLDLVA